VVNSGIKKDVVSSLEQPNSVVVRKVGIDGDEQPTSAFMAVLKRRFMPTLQNTTISGMNYSPGKLRGPFQLAMVLLVKI
jgi:hypothetical protein